MDRPRGGNEDEARYSALVDSWLGTHGSANTRAAYRADLATFGRWCAQRGAMPLRVDSNDVAAFQAARLLAGDSASTLRRRWSSLSSFYQYAVDADAASANPVLGTNRPKTASGDPSPTAVLSAGAVDEYLAQAAALDPRLEALVSLLVFDGLKMGEALALDVDDVTGSPPKVMLILRRNGTERRIALGSVSARAVKRCAGRRSGEPLFTRAQAGSSDTRPRRLTRFGADHLIRQLDVTGGRVTANALRRFHITSSHASGEDIDVIRRRTGLDSARSLRRYLDDPTTDDDSGDSHDAGDA